MAGVAALLLIRYRQLQKEHEGEEHEQDDEFYLIGYSSIFGKLCEYWEDVDFNIQQVCS